MRIMKRFTGLVLVLSAAMGGGACAAAAAAGAGAAAGWYFTSRGVESRVPTDVAQLDQQTRDAFQAMGIAMSSAEDQTDPTHRHFEGKTASGDKTVSVDLDRGDDNLTKVSVTAQDNMVQYDKDLARSVLARIVGENNMGTEQTPPAQ